MNQVSKWLLCPICGNKTRVKIFEKTILADFPLYCPKCKHETIISVQHYEVKIVIEPDA